MLAKDYVVSRHQRTQHLPPLHLFVSGGAGTGKSALLRALVATLRRTVDRRSVAVMAPTGTAAFLINGFTIHSLLSQALFTYVFLDGTLQSPICNKF